MDIPKITPLLLEQLKKVKPSRDEFGTGIEYYPCKVTLKDGSSFDRVYVQESESYITHWGVWPKEDNHKKSIPITEVVQIEESPFRLPAKLANKMYKAGESGMGYCVFTLVLEDGEKLPCVTGNAVDFPNLPPDVNPSMIIDLLPHKGREELQDGRGRSLLDQYKHVSDYYWCLYEKI
ncbi:MAG: hypothetical protein AAB019_01235 [Planctomycetota bacterium]